ncbi:MAG: SRPBCC domain-containing protein [Planctomycetes bacterium]|nr:SRPBCC domain-containing protein [Planctomycetota bacterium]
MKELNSYTLERQIAASCEEVFAAFTNPKLVEKWFWGAAARNTSAMIEARLGGRIHVETDRQDAFEPIWGDRWAVTGFFTLWEAPTKLCFTQRWLAPVFYNNPGMNPLDESILVELTPSLGGTRLRYAHLGIPDAAATPHHKHAVASTLDDLKKLLEGGKA